MMPRIVKTIDAARAMAQIPEDMLFRIPNTLPGDAARVQALLEDKWPGLMTIEAIDAETRARCVHFMRFGALYGKRVKSRVTRALLMVPPPGMLLIPADDIEVYRRSMHDLRERIQRSYTTKRIKYGDKAVATWSELDEDEDYVLIECR